MQELGSEFSELWQPRSFYTGKSRGVWSRI